MSDKCADSAAFVGAQHHQGLTALKARFPGAAAHLDDAWGHPGVHRVPREAWARYGATTPRSA